VNLREGAGGVFEIRSAGVSLWSKKARGRFPEDADLDALLAAADAKP
jgi:selT/selW/selH-like putative selenoprotein